jgi:homoserine O-acetyltransferase
MVRPFQRHLIPPTARARLTIPFARRPLWHGQALHLDAGIETCPFRIAYQTYGTLNAERSNAVLVCHADGDQHVANLHPVTHKPGWWETMVGPRRPIDTERYFVIARTWSEPAWAPPGGLDQPDPHALGPRVPVITIRDMVQAQAMLLDHLGIDSLFSIAGGSMGGMRCCSGARAIRAGCSRRCRSRLRPTLRAKRRLS